MNGLLSRLAASATGHAAVVRSDARLPYSGAVSDWAEEPAPAGPTSDSAAAPRLLGPASPQQASPVHLSRPTVAADGAAPGARDVRHRVEIARTPPHDMMTEIVDDALPRSPSQPASQRHAGIAADSALLAGFAEPPSMIAAAARVTPREGGASSLVQDAAIAAPRASSFDADAVPAPLLPRTTRNATFISTASSSALPAQGASPHTSGPSGAEESTEVHIHIGRIEVTALHEPAPPVRQRAPAAARAPLSLDDYLAARRRSAS